MEYMKTVDRGVLAPPVVNVQGLGFGVYSPP